MPDNDAHAASLGGRLHVQPQDRRALTPVCKPDIPVQGPEFDSLGCCAV
jgi:hypothetical protein